MQIYGAIILNSCGTFLHKFHVDFSTQQGFCSLFVIHCLLLLLVKCFQAESIVFPLKNNTCIVFVQCLKQVLHLFLLNFFYGGIIEILVSGLQYNYLIYILCNYFCSIFGLLWEDGSDTTYFIIAKILYLDLSNLRFLLGSQTAKYGRLKCMNLEFMDKVLEWIRSIKVLSSKFLLLFGLLMFFSLG